MFAWPKILRIGACPYSFLKKDSESWLGKLFFLLEYVGELRIIALRRRTWNFKLQTQRTGLRALPKLLLVNYTRQQQALWEKKAAG